MHKSHCAASNLTANPVNTDRPFAGALGEEYDFIKLICPNVPVLHSRIADVLAKLPSPGPGYQLNVIELGCGTGLLTAAVLGARADVAVQAVDIEPVMLDQARVNLDAAVIAGRLQLTEQDALEYLTGLATASVDVVVSAYCLHNFTEMHRGRTVAEIWRVLRPGGVFVNGDRYALDDTALHLLTVQQEVANFFSTFLRLQRLELLEKWLLHLLSDESPDRIMRAGAASEMLRDCGFVQLTWLFRSGVDGLLTALKPF